MLSAVVCDDEAPALELMTEMLIATGLVAPVTACQSVHHAIDTINAGGIDLFVADIEMPDINGFGAYERILVRPRPLLIFATAHPEYAIDAFSVDAIDYLLKPIDPARVEKAVEKAVRVSRLIASSEAEDAKHVDDPPDSALFLKLRDAGRYYFIPYSEVIWIEAAGDYSLLHMHERETAVRVSIKTLETQLPAARFVRVHRSAIVSLPHIREVRLLSKGEALIKLVNDSAVRASRSYTDAVHRITQGLKTDKI
jgi:two-component system LytT family response regulator